MSQSNSKPLRWNETPEESGMADFDRLRAFICELTMLNQVVSLVENEEDIRRLAPFVADVIESYDYLLSYFNQHKS